MVVGWHSGCSIACLKAHRARRVIERYEQEAIKMTIKLSKKATLGDLIAAVTDEVSRLTRGSANTNILVSYIVRDILAKRRARPESRGVLKVA
jgi:hypothetical protein